MAHAVSDRYRKVGKCYIYFIYLAAAETLGYGEKAAEA